MRGGGSGWNWMVVGGSGWEWVGVWFSSTHFQFLSGLSFDKSNILFQIVSPYAYVIIYLDCKGNGTRTINKSTELLTYLRICRNVALCLLCLTTGKALLIGSLLDGQYF